MQPYPVLSAQDVEAARRRLLAVADGLDDRAGREAADLLRRLTPDQWTPEWHLPFWLGEDFGLPAGQWRLLVEVNLLGAGHVRLVDDLADRPMDEAARETRSELAGRLLAVADDLLSSLFAVAKDLAVYRDGYLSQWRQAGGREDELRSGGRTSIEQDWRWLAWRGAPAKITAAGACLLAGRSAVIPAVEACIDRTMAATVLLDHADDWPEDLEAGRFNAYAVWLGGQHMLAAILRDGGAAHQDYYRMIDRHMVEAQVWAGQVGSAGLTCYLAWLRDDAGRRGDFQLQEARQALHGALAGLLNR